MQITPPAPLKVIVTGLKPRASDTSAFGSLARDSYATLAPVTPAVPPGSTEEDVATLLTADGYSFSKLVLDPSVQVTVSDTDTDSLDPKHLKIGQHTTLIEFHDAFTRKIGLPHAFEDIPGSSFATLTGNGDVQVGTTSVGVHATLRVPLGEETSKLPEGLGQIPLTPLSDCDDVPESLLRRGGFLAPLWQSEALTMNFHDWSGTSPAVKVSVKGLNAITGLPMNVKPEGEETIQDYISPAIQPWLDGITLKPGVTQQFVAAPIAPGATFASKTDSTSSSSNPPPPTPATGLQFDFFRRLNDAVSFTLPSSSTPLDIHQTPSSLSLPSGSLLTMSTQTRSSNGSIDLFALSSPSSSVPFTVIDSPLRGTLSLFIRTESRPRLIPIRADPGESIERVLEKVGVVMESVKNGQWWIEVGGEELEKSKSLAELGVEDRAFLELKGGQDRYRNYDNIRPNVVHRYKAHPPGGAMPMLRAMAAPPAPIAPVEIGQGGLVEQRILPDPLPSTSYSRTPTHRTFIHTVSPAAYEKMTGEPCPASLATKDEYRSYGIEWKDEYEEGQIKVREKKDEEEDGKVWSRMLEEDQVGGLWKGSKVGQGKGGDE